MKNLFRNLTLLIVTITLLASCGSKEMKKAKEYMDAQMYSDAISLLKIEIQDSPKNAEASFLLGKCYLELNENSKAKEVFKRAILLNTDYKNKVGKIYFDLALNSCKESSFRKANLFYNEAIKYDPTGKEKFSENLYNYGNEKSTSSTNADDVIEILDDVVRINPSYKEKTADLTYNLAVSFIEKGFVDDGFQYAKFSIKNDPKHIKDISDLYFNYATSLLSIPDKENESVGYFNEAIKLNKELVNKVAEKFKNVAKECESKNEIQDALLFARQCAELNSEYEFYYKELKIKYQPDIVLLEDDFNRYESTEIGNGWIYGSGDYPQNYRTRIKAHQLYFDVPRYCRNELLKEVNVQNYLDYKYIIIEYDLHMIKNAVANDCTSEVSLRENNSGTWYKDAYLRLYIGLNKLTTGNEESTIRHSIDFSQIHRIKIVLDNNTKLFNCYIDGNIMIEKAKLSNNGIKTPRYLNITTGSYYNGGQFYYDNIKVYATN